FPLAGASGWATILAAGMVESFRRFSIQRTTTHSPNGGAMRHILPSIALLLAVNIPSFSQKLDDKIADRLYESAKVFGEVLNAPDGGIPKSLLKDAECVAVIPAVKKAALGFGGQYGRGAVTCRKDKGAGPWGPPAMIGITGGSFGLQLGGQSYDVVMLFMTPDSVEHLLKDKLTLGGDMAAAVGPKGRAI